jgi:1-acyl-sn-glycerol-3-phosphate acyltransferase
MTTTTEPTKTDPGRPPSRDAVKEPPETPPPAKGDAGLAVDHPPLVWKFVQTLFRIYFSVFFDLKAYGVKNVPHHGGALMVSNHQSLLDPPLLGVRVKRPMSYMAKSELFKHGWFAWIIRRLGAFPVRQGAGDVGAIKETVARLKEGRMLNIFPEGGRTEDGEIQPMQSGVALVVRRAGVPIIPVAIHGSYEAWPKGERFFHRHPIRVVYGPPLDVTGMKGDDIVRLIDRSIRTLFERLRSGQMTDKLAAEPLH